MEEGKSIRFNNVVFLQMYSRLVIVTGSWIYQSFQMKILSFSVFSVQKILFLKIVFVVIYNMLTHFTARLDQLFSHLESVMKTVMKNL